MNEITRQQGKVEYFVPEKISNINSAHAKSNVDKKVL